ncbi:hypothetical protein BC832DRAFT_539987 [Gaertneriomyces semiglobifer]|nr:hypothetical protein BC832DRAFT_539987 [Gaertneriomyces semiglobifer]
MSVLRNVWRDLRPECPTGSARPKTFADTPPAEDVPLGPLATAVKCAIAPTLYSGSPSVLHIRAADNSNWRLLSCFNDNKNNFEKWDSVTDATSAYQKWKSRVIKCLKAIRLLRLHLALQLVTSGCSDLAPYALPPLDPTPSPGPAANNYKWTNDSSDGTFVPNNACYSETDDEQDEMEMKKHLELNFLSTQGPSFVEDLLRPYKNSYQFNSVDVTEQFAILKQEAIKRASNGMLEWKSGNIQHILALGSILLIDPSLDQNTAGAKYYFQAAAVLRDPSSAAAKFFPDLSVRADGRDIDLLEDTVTESSIDCISRVFSKAIELPYYPFPWATLQLTSIGRFTNLPMTEEQDDDEFSFIIDVVRPFFEVLNRYDKFRVKWSIRSLLQGEVKKATQTRSDLVVYDLFRVGQFLREDLHAWNVPWNLACQIACKGAYSISCYVLSVRLADILFS